MHISMFVWLAEEYKYSVTAGLLNIILFSVCTPASNTVYVAGATIANTTQANCQIACRASVSCSFYTWNSVTLVK